ncbi:helix-turn-helix domain-containing protein [Nocardia sp. IBHARD005]|uniref:helix-turn-helix domain-containing protein n=1 Tax=Nocardia sp. IBHARD005 TaxID=3457765 RepID=UPI0040590F23
MAVTGWTGVEVRAMRSAALRITQAELAERLGFTESVVRKWEKRGATITLTHQHAAAMDTLLVRLGDDQRRRFESACSAVQPPPMVTTNVDPFGRPDTVVGQLQQPAELRGDSELVEALSLALGSIVDRYEAEGPRHLASEVQDLRQRVNLLLQQRRHPAHVEQLNRIAARLSGVLAYMAVNCGRFGSARMYCREAQVLASLIEDPEMLAWTKATESFCAYYAGDFVRAVTLADHQNTVPGLTPALTFQAYGTARLMANTATAFLSAGRFDKALEFGGLVEDHVSRSDSVWSRTLVHLDVATALVLQRSPDVEHAVQLGIEALDVSADRPIRSVWQRAKTRHAVGLSTASAVT